LTTYTLGSNVENWTALGTAVASGTGNSLNNVMTGNSAANTIDGGTGNDTLTGGADNDRFNITAGTDTVTDLGNGGADVLVVSAGATVNATVVAAWTASSTTANSGAVNLTTNGFAVNLAAATTGTAGYFIVSNTGAATTLTGSSLADCLTGGAGNDTLVGGAGADTLAGGLGADTFVLAGNDRVVDFNSAQLDAVDLTGLADGNGVTFTFVTGVLDLSASKTSAAFTANSDGNGANITGGAGADSLNGGAAADVLSGGTGNDTITGGSGADIITGGQGNDVIFLGESISAADVVVFAGGTGTAGSTARILTLGVDTITGINLGTATTAVDKLQFSAADFGIASGTTVLRGASAAVTGGPVANTDGNFYILTAAPTSTGVDLNGTAAGANGAIVFVGSATGAAGVDVYFTSNEGSFSTSTAVKIATLVGINTANINATDLTFVA